MKGLRGKYFIDFLRSFTISSPEYADGWKAVIIDAENNDFDVVAFKVPKKLSNEVIFIVEKMIQDKLA